jgi:hypothetical protein
MAIKHSLLLLLVETNGGVTGLVIRCPQREAV